MPNPDSPAPAGTPPSSEGLEATSPGFRTPRTRMPPPQATTPPESPPESPSAPTRGRRRRLGETVRKAVANRGERPPAELGRVDPGTSFRASSGDVRALTSLGAMAVVVLSRTAGLLLRARLGDRVVAASRTEAKAIARPLARFVGRRFELSGDVRSAADLTEALFALAHYAERVAGWEVNDADLEAAAADLERLHPDNDAKPRRRRPATEEAQTPAGTEAVTA
jgi:hypothetical protein